MGSITNGVFSFSGPKRVYYLQSYHPNDHQYTPPSHHQNSFTAIHKTNHFHHIYIYIYIYIYIQNCSS